MSIRNLIILITVVLTFIIPFTTDGARQETKPFTVVIDAGHGGKDVGAVDNNVKEKDINLGVALALADKIKKGMKNVKVVMTRDNDTFISLQQRAEKANKAKADLFISIHTNSVDASNKNRKNVSGASVYALGLHKDANNMAVARRENAVIELEKNHEQNYKGFDPNSDESYIIFEMAQKKNLSQSIKFADEVQRQLVETAGRADRKVHQAGFWVLWATSMPAVLIELDFICNPNSAVYMASQKGQKQLAQAIFNAVKKYRHDLLKTTASRLSSLEESPIYDKNEDMTVLIPVSEVPDRIVSEPPTHGQTTLPARRRRRSVAAKELSDRRNLEASSITVKTYSGFTATAAAPAVSPVTVKNSDMGEPVSEPKADQKLLDVSSVAKSTDNSDHSEKNRNVRIYKNRKVVINDMRSSRDKIKTSAAKRVMSTGDDSHLKRPSLRGRRK